MILVWHLFSNNQKGVEMFLEWSNMLESWNRSWNWIMDLCLHPLCCFMVVGLRLELITEATPHTNETMLLFYLQIFHIYYMNSMKLVFPSQIQQVLFWNDPKMPFWKILLHRQPRSGRVVANTFEHNKVHTVLFYFSSILPYLPLTQLADLAQIFNYFRTWVW